MVNIYNFFPAELNFARKKIEVEHLSDKKITDLLITIYISPRYIWNQKITMPFIYAGLRLIPGKFDKLKLHDISYETTTGEKLKQLILSELEKRSQLYVSSNETESKEKKFKGDVPCGQESQCEAVADVYTQTKFSPEEIGMCSVFTLCFYYYYFFTPKGTTENQVKQTTSSKEEMVCF